eukprot:jgi/Psemu1/62051/gm1.62051_g
MYPPRRLLEPGTHSTGTGTTLCGCQLSSPCIPGTAILAYLAHISAWVEVHDPYLPFPLRQNDIALMHLALQWDFPSSFLHCINYYTCLFLKVTFLSEICTIDDTAIPRPAILAGRRDTVYRITHSYVT